MGGSRSREAVAERAHSSLRDRDGDAGSSASERRRAGGRDGERQRAAPAGSGLQPREAPPTSRPSLPALRATLRTGARTRAAEGKHPLSRVGLRGGVPAGGGTLGQVLPRPRPSELAKQGWGKGTEPRHPYPRAAEVDVGVE